MVKRSAGRPALERMNGKPAAEYWAEVERFRDALGLTQAQMASAMGMSRGSYSVEMANGTPPSRVAWKRFTDWKAAQGEWSLYKEEGVGLVWDSGAEALVPLPLPYPARLCDNRRSACPDHRPVFLPRTKRQRFCCLACGADFRKQQKKKKEGGP